uniref:Transmembrane protein 65 n=1 Tax=Acrobeloides nanus TaxID=290746 RepID=A0A914EM35_9BILA
MYNSPIRYSTSGLINQLDHLRIDNINDARALVGHLHPPERELLKTALKEQWDKSVHLDEADITFTELKQLFVVNMMPFVGFGILDNMIMICAGEYIDQQLGALLCISTMAAAALGNIISDVAGVGLAHYVEDLVLKAGIKHPTLNSDQLESSKARYTVNASRAVGLVIGCFIGMFPLLFFDKEAETTKECDA